MQTCFSRYQQAIAQLGYPLDIIDAVILDFCYHWKANSASAQVTLNKKTYVWYNYNFVITNNPLLGIKADSVYRRMKALEEKGFCELHPDSELLGRAYWYLTPKVAAIYTQIDSYSRPAQPPATPSEINPTPLPDPRTQLRPPSDQPSYPAPTPSDPAPTEGRALLIEERPGLGRARVTSEENPTPGLRETNKVKALQGLAKETAPPSPPPSANGYERRPEHRAAWRWDGRWYDGACMNLWLEENPAMAEVWMGQAGARDSDEMAGFMTQLVERENGFPFKSRSGMLTLVSKWFGKLRGTMRINTTPVIEIPRGTPASQLTREQRDAILPKAFVG